MLCAGALGSIIVGYLGVEVAEQEVFEKLLWLQRVYNDNTPVTLVQHFLLMGMGGPLHQAVLAALDKINESRFALWTERERSLALYMIMESSTAFFLFKSLVLKLP
jgi:uncharacterized membrane-anchored protein